MLTCNAFWPFELLPNLCIARNEGNARHRHPRQLSDTYSELPKRGGKGLFVNIIYQSSWT